jgi:hypothetical protein
MGEALRSPCKRLSPGEQAKRNAQLDAEWYQRKAERQKRGK